MPTVDLLVIGGGIHGACVARDAALRGLSVTLVEKGDLASGTSSRSSKLIHGGIRYLETGQFGLVREALREREILLRTAPSLVRPVDFVLPFYEGASRPPWFLRAGLTLYDFLAGSGHPHHIVHERDALLAAFPFIPREGLKGGAAFADAQMDDALLVVANAMDAAAAGATIRVGTEVRRLVAVEGAWRASFPDGEVIEARMVVNAAGPWVDTIRGRATDLPPPASLRLTRGTHIVVPSLTRDYALLLFAEEDDRVFFVLPWADCSLVGTTDTDDASGPDAVTPAADDVRYLWDELARRWPQHDPSASTLRVFAGLRPLARSRRDRPWDNSREARLLVEDGLISMVGGKFTTARLLAEHAVDLVVKRLERHAEPCVTTMRELPALSSEAVLSPEGVVRAIDEQFARHVSDVLFRRSSLWLDAAATRAAAPGVAAIMAPRLGWSDVVRQAEIASVLAQLDAEERILEETRS
jgi:glycerol-3-phosphate dehydrogenase